MKQDLLKIKNDIVNQTFDDPRKLRLPPSEVKVKLSGELFSEGDIFQTEDGEYIYFDVQLSDFTEAELVKYVEIAEKLYEIVGKKVHIYLLCPKTTHVYVNEFKIMSESDFIIRLARYPHDPAEVILNIIKRKIANNEILNEDDLNALIMIPSICEKIKLIIIDWKLLKYLIDATIDYLSHTKMVFPNLEI